jgi:hypothetical protein
MITALPTRSVTQECTSPNGLMAYRRTLAAPLGTVIVVLSALTACLCTCAGQVELLHRLQVPVGPCGNILVLHVPMFLGT